MRSRPLASDDIERGDFVQEARVRRRPAVVAAAVTVGRSSGGSAGGVGGGDDCTAQHRRASCLPSGGRRPFGATQCSASRFLSTEGKER
jgi:hypothetical protein